MNQAMFSMWSHVNSENLHQNHIGRLKNQCTSRLTAATMKIAKTRPRNFRLSR